MKPFLDGKKTTGRSLCAFPASIVTTAPSPLINRPAKPGLASPTIEAVKEGDKVIRLVITCACGERMEVECLYPPGA
ncbi:MAG TPA: hypothetical protein VGL42_12690 [Opitutaceae bacterium]|jgi:hypothetical protein